MRGDEARVVGPVVDHPDSEDLRRAASGTDDVHTQRVLDALNCSLAVTGLTTTSSGQKLLV